MIEASACSRRGFLVGSAAAIASVEAIGAETARKAVIDTHTHFYDPSRPEGVPWPGKGDVLHRPTLPSDWERVARPFGVTGTVVVEASPWVEDNQWLLDQAERHEPAPGMLGVVGVVGNLPIGDDGCEQLIDRFAAHPRFRGIRVNGDKLLAGLADGRYADHLARVVDRDLAVDVHGGRVFDAVAQASARFPKLRLVLDHMGGVRLPPTGPEQQWQDSIARVAELPNLFVKVSGMLEPAANAARPNPAPTDTTYYEPWLEYVWKTLGVDRLMFGSNWPVSNRGGTYADVIGIVRPFVSRKGADAERRFFAETSRAAYRWVDPAR